MRIVIIGGSGFIGTRLSSRLDSAPDRNYLIVDKAPPPGDDINYKYGNVLSEQSLQEVMPENSIIINLAAEHRDDIRPKSLYWRVNVDGAAAICNVARMKNINKIIFTSSVAVYGFAPVGTDEFGKISPFNEYGRTKWEAEKIFTNWQKEDSERRCLVIVRPTVVFGEGNRGNVFNLFKKIASGKFIMIGNGLNKKSLAYVENVAAFLEYSLDFKQGIHIFNYADKPDYSMVNLVSHIMELLGRSKMCKLKIPYFFGLGFGRFLDLLSYLTGAEFQISAIRIRKFCANSIYDSSVQSTGFKPPVPLDIAIKNTIGYEFIEKIHNNVFYTE